MSGIQREAKKKSIEIHHSYSKTFTFLIRCVLLIGLYFQIVNPDTNEIISEPNVTGELLLKGPSVTKVYYFILFS